MRVTASSFPNVLSAQFQRLSVEQARLQTQAATGQRFTFASEDPRAMRKVLDLQAEMKTLRQFDQNIATLKDSLDASFAAMKGVKSISDRAGEIATLSDGLRTDADMTTYGTEVDQLLERAVQLANTRHQASFLFAGTANIEAPFSVTRDANNRITAVAYEGNADVPEIEIADGISIATTVPGSNTTDGGVRGLFTDSRTGADFFNHLISLRDHLMDGDSTAVHDTDMAALRDDEDNILFHYGNTGAVETRLQVAATLAQGRARSLEGLVSQESDADLAETMVSLSEIQNAYTAALKTGGTILSQSLLDYI